MPTAYLPGNGRITLGLDDAQLTRIESALIGIRDGAEKAQRAALNDTARWAKTQLNRKMREHLNLLARDVAQRIRITKLANAGDMEAVIRLDWQKVPLLDFKARFLRSVGVTVTTVKGQGPHVFKHQFLASMLSGHMGTFERIPGAVKRQMKSGRYAPKVIGPAQRVEGVRTSGGRTARRVRRAAAKVVLRQPIHETYGVSVLAAFELAPGLADEALREIGDKLNERVESKIAWQLERGTPDVPHE